jgi:pSer/pThr/pTyr-binding forkhead associated (FHA) protein
MTAGASSAAHAGSGSTGSGTPGENGSSATHGRGPGSDSLVNAVQSALEGRAGGPERALSDGAPSVESAPTPVALQPVDPPDGASERSVRAGAAFAATPLPENEPKAGDGAGGSVDAPPCPSCDIPVPKDFLFCGNCGHRMLGAAAPTSATRSDVVSVAPTAAARGQLILIRPDGTEGGSIPLHEGETIIGRTEGALFESDVYLSPKHASLTLGEDYLIVTDLGSLNGVFVRMLDEEEIESTETFRMGQELLRFDTIDPPAPLADGTELMGSPNPGFWGRLSVVVGRDVLGSAFPLFGDAVVLGRERGDILFPEDGYVSGTHARISHRAGRFFLADLGSSNGTFIRVRADRAVKSGAFVLMGQQLFRVTYRNA